MKTVSHLLPGCAVVLLLALTMIRPADVLAQSLGSSFQNAPANGNGVMIAGELWDSFMPANRGPYNSEASRTLVDQAPAVGRAARGM